MRTSIIFKNPLTGQGTEVNQRHIDEVAEDFGLDQGAADALEAKLRKDGSASLPRKGFSVVWRDFEPTHPRS
jgi:hypothetical protein